MTSPALEDSIFTGIRLAEAVGAGDGATIRLISSEVDSAAIQENGTKTFIAIFLILNGLDGADFPNDVWRELPNFLIKDIHDRSFVLGFREEFVSGILGSFLTQNVFATVEGKEAQIINPDKITAGYFHIAVSVGEAIYGLLKVAATQRFEGDYQMALALTKDYLALQLAAQDEDFDEALQ